MMACEKTGEKLAMSMLKHTLFTYIFGGGSSGEAKIACDLGFEYAVLPQVDFEAICCLCNLREKKKKIHREENVH